VLFAAVGAGYTVGAALVALVFLKSGMLDLLDVGFWLSRFRSPSHATPRRGFYQHPHPHLTSVLRISSVLALVFAIACVYLKLIRLTATTVALTFLLACPLIATVWDWRQPSPRR